MNIDKLAPAPWKAEGERLWPKSGPALAKFQGWASGEPEACAEFCALARNAFDVMMRRGFGVKTWHHPERGQQWKATDTGGFFLNVQYAADPFTALVEADRWYRENVESVTPAADLPAS